jgi:DNA-binding response OmpR family regulator
MNSRLSRKRVLVVEDNSLLAMALEDLLESEGVNTVGPAGSVAAGLELLRDDGIDAAILDIELGNERVWPLAERLREQAIPFVFLSAVCDRDEVPERFRSQVCMSKPAEPRYLMATVEELLAA